MNHSYKVLLAGAVMGTILTEIALSSHLGLIAAAVIGAIVAFLGGLDLAHEGEVGHLGLGAGIGGLYASVWTGNPDVMMVGSVGVAGLVTTIAWGALETRRHYNLRIVFRRGAERSAR